MEYIKNYIKDRTTPMHLSPKDGIQYWQERVLLTLLMAGSILGFITWIPSVYLSIKEDIWIVAVADTLVLGFVLFLFFKPHLPYKIRAGSVPLLSYLLGMILLLTLGPHAGGPVWLFFFPVLTGVLLGARPAVWALVLNTVTVILVGYLIQQNLEEIFTQFNFKNWHLVVENPGMKWVVICFNFMLLNILSTVSVTTILNGLHNSLLDLSVSEKKHRRIFDNILDVYFETSLDGKILEVSPSVEQFSS